jgi:hypothetical protein
MIALLALLAEVALGQSGQNSAFVGDGRDCLNPSAIYGTSGFANAQQALDTNATTYSAAAFAERLGLDQPSALLEDKKTRGLLIWEVNETFDAARVPTYHHTDDAYITQPDCDAQYRVGLRGADLQATLLAGVFGTPHFGAFFAASQTSGQVASTDNLMRGIYWGYLYPIYSTAPLVFSPFFQGQSRAGTAVFALDAVYGAWFDNRWLLAKAGYTKSSGLYATARDTTLGLFFTTVVRPGDGSVPMFRAGIQRLDPGDKLGDDAKLFGMPSLFYRDIPLAQPLGVDEEEGVPHQRHRTTHLRLEDVGRMFDLASTFRIRPEPSVSEAVVGVHSRTYHLRVGEAPERARAFVLAKGGVVQLLEQPSLGVAGGLYASTRLEAGYKGPGSSMWIHLQLNDAEQLALYPFARNAVSSQLHIEVSKW